jgi:hypothetical protein
MVTHATFRHAWQTLYRNLTLVDVKGTSTTFYLVDRVLSIYETLRGGAVSSIAAPFWGIALGDLKHGLVAVAA